jgi:hypothetical protein
MQPPTPRNAVAVEVVPTRPTDADAAAIAHLSSTAGRELAPVAYLVKIRLDPKPPPTSTGWALYVGDFRVPKYWDYPEGIYFKVFDPNFFADHRGQALRFPPIGPISSTPDWCSLNPVKERNSGLWSRPTCRDRRTCCADPDGRARRQRIGGGRSWRVITKQHRARADDGTGFARSGLGVQPRRRLG